MTVATNDTIERYTISGTGPYAYGFRIFADTDLAVTVIDASTGAPTTLALTTHYTVAGANDEDGGTLTLTAAAASAYSGDTLDIRSNTALEQPTQLNYQAAYRAQDVEKALDRLARQIQDINRKVRASVRLPDTLDQDAVLSPLSGWLSKYLYINASGQLEAAAAVGTTNLTQALIGGLLYPQSAAELAAGVTPTNLYRYYDDPRRLGAVGDGTTSDYDALSKMALVGGHWRVPSNFHMAIPSASLATASITPIAGFTLEGTGGTSRITVTGTTACNLFVTTNVSDIKLRRLRIRGNSQASSSANGSLWYCKQTTGATAVGRRYRVLDCVIENFKGDYWLRFENLSGTYAMRDIRIGRCDFFSESGNARAGANVGVPSTMIQLYGQDNGTSGVISDVDVFGNTADGTYIKSFFIGWQSVSRVKLRSNNMRQFGLDASISDDCGAYAILFYKQASAGSDPDLIELRNNSIDGVRSCGVYMVGCARAIIDGLLCMGQTDTVDATLPKGAVAINGCGKVTVRNVDAYSCARGIQASGSVVRTSRYRFSDIDIDSTVNSAQGFKITCAVEAPTGRMQSCEVDGLSIRLTGTTTTGIVCDFGSTYGINSLSFRNFNVSATARGIQMLRGDSTAPDVRQITIANGEIADGGSFGLQMESWTNTSQRVTLDSIVFAGGFGSSAYALSLDNTVGLEIHDLTFRDITGGSQYAVSSAGATGSMSGIAYQNVAAAQRVRSSGGTDLGRSTPTHSGNQGDFVQNLNTADHDTDEMTLVGWRNANGGTTWRTQYMSSVSPAS